MNAREAKRRRPHTTTAGRRFPAERLTDDELAAILRTCSKRAPSGLRDRFLLALLDASGVRVSEALALNVGDIDKDLVEVRVRRGKGGKPRHAITRVSCRPALESFLAAWMDARKVLGIKRTAPLFCTISAGNVGHALNPSVVRGMVARRAAKAGVPHRVHPHCFRHRYALEVTRAGVPVAMLSRSLGHANVGTTATYLATIGADDVVEAFARCGT